MKKLVDGLKIQNEKGNVERENEIWFKQVEKNLNKHNLNNTCIYLVNYNNGQVALEKEDIFECLASKNLSDLYLNDNNNLVFKNEELGLTIEILKELTKDEYEKIIDGE